MNREAIVKRVARQIRPLSDRYKKYPNCAIDLEKMKISDILTAAGFFDLLDAATELSKPTPNYQEYLGRQRRVDAAIAKINGTP